MSVIVPCYNHAATLPWALASLVAQTRSDWECVLVDDGSVDEPEAVVAAFDDPRISLIRLEENRGRSAARQVALDRARGEFIALLDADDWLYPRRFETQLECFDGAPELAAVASGMAIVDVENLLLGVRGCGDARGTGSGPRALPARYGTSTVMLRGHVARSQRFDPALRQAEDADYLGRVLAGRPYRVLAAPLYVYREEPRGIAERSFRAHSLRRHQARSLGGRFPARARLRMLESYLKMAAYGAAGVLGLDRLVAASRNTAATGPQRREFERAREAVAAVVDAL